jgi:mannose-6-phosphate isomerase-like protein (cupin superfamily)
MTLSDQTFIAFNQFKIRILKTGKETNGEYDLLEYIVFPKARTAVRHYHKDFSERYTVISGMMILEIGEDYKLLTPGESFIVEPGQVHTFFNHTSDEVRFTTEIRPSSESFIKALIIRQGLVKNGLCNKKGLPKKLSHLTILINLSQTYPTGFRGFLQNFFISLAEKPKMKKLEAELIKKYYEPYL